MDIFFFSSRRRHTRYWRDWSSDVCSSDLCFETSRPTTHSDPTYEVDGVTHYCVANMPGAVPITSTRALTNSTMPYVLALADHGVLKAATASPHIANGVNVVDGKVTYAAVAEATGHEYVPLFEALGSSAAA